MGSCSSQKQNQGLPNDIRVKALQIFKKMDVDGSGSIEREETQKFWQKNFAKVNTQALFNQVDFDKSGQITEDEWLAFWEIVKKSGYTDKEIHEELDNLLQGGAWVGFRKVDEFVKRDQMRKKSQIKQIVQDNQKRMSIAEKGTLQDKTIQNDQ
ncbi:hypothetical protein pb186bvf_004096 [Paramecium bursaria]